MKKKALGYYDYTVILTYCGMLFAFTGILRVISQNYWEAVFCLMFAGVCDMFGIQIDSFCDLISFGILPGLFVYMISGQNAFVGLISSLFVLCALIRLSYFNVMEEERQSQTEESRKSYLGIPVTTMAVLLPFFYLMYDYRLCKTVVCFPVLLTFMGFGFLCPVEIKKPGVIGKVCLILVGIFEVYGMIRFMGWNMV